MTINIYYISIKDFLNQTNKQPDDITVDIIDESICQPRYFHEKMTLYEREDFIKNEIQLILKEGKLRYKLAFYAFAFKFFNKIRKKIVQKDIKRMIEKMKEIEIKASQ